MIKKKIEDFKIPDNSYCKITEMGNVTEVMYSMKPLSHDAKIQKIDSERFVVLSTGEVKSFIHYESRADGYGSLTKTFSRIRALINTNIVVPENCRWITLTYAENMTDRERLYRDFEKFNKRFIYYCCQNELDKPEYISVIEPQQRGAWHIHMFYIFDSKAPFIANDTLAGLWGHGFVKIQKCDSSVDNVGAYLTAYLSNIPLDEYRDYMASFGLDPDECKPEVVEHEVPNDENLKEKKKFVKGGRLCLYPSGMNIYRCSRGIKQPSVTYETFTDSKKASLGELTFSRTISVEDTDFSNVFSYEYYNTKR